MERNVNVNALSLCCCFFIISLLHCRTCYATLHIVSKAEWGGRPPTDTTPLAKGVPHVAIHHSAGAYCNTPAKCRQQMRIMQDYHMNTLHWQDIGYNYAIGADGAVYEGRGAAVLGAHASSWNPRSIGVVFIGNYNDHVPTAVQIQLAHELFAHLMATGHLRANFTLYGHRQLRATECPGNHLYREIQTWPQWRSETAAAAATATAST